MHLDNIKILLGDAAGNYNDAQIEMAHTLAVSEIEQYCARKIDDTLELVAVQIAVIKLNRINTEGLASQSMSGVSETYINGYPLEIQQILNRKRKLKVIK